MADDFMHDFPFNPEGREDSTPLISRAKEGRSTVYDYVDWQNSILAPCITIKDPDLDVGTEIEFVDGNLEVRVEGLAFSSVPLIQADYAGDSLDRILINFNFPYFRDQDEDRVTVGERIKTVVNLLKTASDENLEEIRSSLVESKVRELKGADKAIEDAEFLTMEFLIAAYENESEATEAYEALARGGWFETLAYWTLRQDPDSDTDENTFLEKLEYYKLQVTGEMDDESRTTIEGISTSRFSADSFEWTEVQGEGGELLEERELNEAGEKKNSKYGKFRIGDRIVELIRMGDESIVLQFMKDGRNLRISVPLNINSTEARRLIEDQTQEPEGIRGVVPFEISVLNRP